jgi:hypothetical protein
MDNPMRSSVSQGNFGQPPLKATLAEEDLASGVSWAAVLGGAFVIAALSVTLLALGSGLGFASVSPWPTRGVSATTLGAGAIVWMIVMQLIASAMGGYLAGRLRTKWTRIHNDEVFFRDTAHGFLSWAVAAVVTVGFLAAAATAMVSGAASGAATGAAMGPTGMSAQSTASAGNEYYVDSLFRSESPDALALTAQNTDISRSEASRIFANALAHPETSSADQAYLSRLIAAKTGMSETDAQQRVNEVTTQMRQDMDDARKAAAHLSIWSFVALLIGAFSASYAATIGGRERDHVVAI